VLENKNGDYLHGHKIILMRGHGETPNFAEVPLLVVFTICQAQQKPLIIITEFLCWGWIFRWG